MNFHRDVFLFSRKKWLCGKILEIFSGGTRTDSIFQEEERKILIIKFI